MKEADTNNRLYSKIQHNESNVKHRQSMGKLVVKGNSTYVDSQERLGNIPRWKHFVEVRAFDEAFNGWVGFSKGQRKKAKAQGCKEHRLGSTDVCWGGGQGTDACRDLG